MRQKILLIAIVLAAILCQSCSKKTARKNIAEGEITYTIGYDSIPLKYDKDLLPSVMTIRFKDNNTSNTITGLSGAVSLSFINNVAMQSSITLVKLFNKKLYYLEPFDSTQYSISYSEMPKLSIRLTDETLVLNGYNCKKAIGYFADSTHLQFEIVYTNEIGINRPNAFTPFEAIDGVMLKFKIKLYNQVMSMEAIAIKPVSVPMEEFSIPPDYEQVNRETIKEVILLLQ